MAPKRSSETLKACDEAYAVWVASGAVFPAEEAIEYKPSVPPIFGQVSVWETMLSRLPSILPATRVVHIPDGVVVGSSGWVVTPDSKVVASLSWYESLERKPPLSKVFWEQLEYLKGKVLNLGTISGSNNYGHFLLDGIGRISVLEIAGMSVADFDWVVIPGFSSRSSNEIVTRLGISQEKIIRLAEGEAISGHDLYTPSLAGTSRIYRPCLPNFLRNNVTATGAGKRIFISRKEARRPISNIDNLEKFLAEKAFEIVDPREVDLPQLIAEAEIIIGAHGAAMADIAFATPGTKIIELIPSDHMFPYFYSLAVAAALDYRVVIGASEHVRELDETGPSPYSFEVDLEALSMALSY